MTQIPDFNLESEETLYICMCPLSLSPLISHSTRFSSSFFTILMQYTLHYHYGFWLKVKFHPEIIKYAYKPYKCIEQHDDDDMLSSSVLSSSVQTYRAVFICVFSGWVGRMKQLRKYQTNM
ncbi:unnamed protein product [Orchesella dallaii]|uniref:Uncharacterized protein n=1 Tax=Orchesella dallaii TaxID=48710 RepID=A0ABP1S6E9_9HEXA